MEIPYWQKVRAGVAVTKAVKEGRLVRPNHCTKCLITCKPHGHHRDYNKPLEVIWLCPKCHSGEHKGEVKLVMGKPTPKRESVNVRLDKAGMKKLDEISTKLYRGVSRNRTMCYIVEDFWDIKLRGGNEVKDQAVVGS